MQKLKIDKKKLFIVNLINLGIIAIFFVPELLHQIKYKPTELGLPFIDIFFWAPLISFINTSIFCFYFKENKQKILHAFFASFSLWFISFISPLILDKLTILDYFEIFIFTFIITIGVSLFASIVNIFLTFMFKLLRKNNER